MGGVQPDRRYLAAGDGDISLLNSARGYDRPAADDQLLASSSMARASTSIATATSSMVTDSAGLWLTPPLQRTNSMPTSVSADMTTASGPAPLASSRTGGPSRCAPFDG